MGKIRTKVVETAIEPEKAEKIENEGRSFDEATKTVDEQDAQTPEKKAPKKGKAKYRSNRYKGLVSLVDKEKSYPAVEAVELVKKVVKSKFDESIEAHINLGLSAEKQEQIRTQITLPHQGKSSGKEKTQKTKTLVFASKNTDEIKKLGADVGTDATLKEIESGKIIWDKIIAEPEYMPKLAKVAKVLGPKGLMPNPKSGTVTDDPAKALREFSGGKMDLRTEKMPVIHIKIGKSSQADKELLENLSEVVSSVKAAKPENFKKELIKSIYLSSTMGPSVKLDPKTLS